MKKVLFATTALVMTAGVASAEITIGGGGYVGFNSNGGTTTFDSRMQANIDGSVTSDSGLSVAARVRVRSQEGAATINAPRITVSTGGVTVAMGNADGAIIQQTSPWNSCLGNVGDFCMSNTWQLAVAQYSGGAGFNDTIRADVALGGASVSVSSDVGNTGGVEVAASTTMGALSVGAGFNLDTDISVLNLNYSADGITAGVRATDDGTAIVGVYASYSAGALTISAFADDTDASGLGVSYDLGGGVAVGGAVDNSDNMQAHISFGF
jgi:outer membrane protein OmpU